MTTPRAVLSAALLALCSDATSAAVEKKSAVVFQSIDFAAAQAAAAQEQKIVFIDFYTTWCAPCKMLDAETWPDAKVGELVNAKAVALKLDAEHDGRAIAERYKVQAYPTLLLVKPDGTVLDRLVGFREANVFRVEFQAALEGRTSLARAAAAVTAAGATDAITHDAVDARMKLAQAQAQSGDKDAALENYLWCFDVGMPAIPSYVGVRTSFLLSYIQRLGTKAANAALLDRCEMAQRRMLADSLDRAAAQDFAALTDTLKQPERMIAVFEMVPPGDPRRAALGPRLYQQFVTLRRYDDALEVMSPARLMKTFENFASLPPAARPDPRIAELRHNLAVKQALDGIEVLTGAGKSAEAQQLNQALLAFDASDATQASVKERMARALAPGPR